MNSYGRKSPNAELFNTNPDKWKSQMRTYLTMLDIFRFVTDIEDDGKNQFVADAGEGKESQRKVETEFRRAKVRATEALWSSIPIIEQNLIDEDLRDTQQAKTIYEAITVRLKEKTSLQELKLMQKWNSLTVERTN